MLPQIPVLEASSASHAIDELCFQVNVEAGVIHKTVGALHLSEVKGWIVCETVEGASVKVAVVMSLLNGQQLRPKLFVELEKQERVVVLVLRRIYFKSEFLVFVYFLFLF
jgi:hypothetical protein